jgi:hypothetical protein
VAGRGYASETGNLPDRWDLAHLDAYVIDGLDAGALQCLVDAGMIRGEWVIMVGHDVDQRGPQTVPVWELDRFCRRVSQDDRHLDRTGARSGRARTIDPSGGESWLTARPRSWSKFKTAIMVDHEAYRKLSLKK